MDDWRAADEWLRNNITQRLATIETSQKLYHDELKSIMETMHKEFQALKTGQSELRWTLYGGPRQDDIGLLEKVRGILWKFGLATTAGFGMVAFVLKLFSPALTRMAEKIVGNDPASQYRYQSGKKKLKHWNKETGQFEYYIEFKPVGLDVEKN